MNLEDRAILTRLVNRLTDMLQSFAEFRTEVTERLDKIEVTIATIRTNEIRDILNEAAVISSAGKNGRNGEED